MSSQFNEPNSSDLNDEEIQGVSLEDLGGEDFDDYYDEEIEEEPRRPMPPPSYRPMPSPARPRTSPLFQHAEQFPQATQFRVYHLNEGQPHSVGVIAIDANEEEFIRKFLSACPGKFVLRPVDDQGNYLGSEFTHTVSPHHPALSSGLQVGAPQPSTSTDMVVELMREREALMAEKERRLEAEIRRREQAQARERQLIQNQRDELAAERVAMAAQASTTTASISERQLEAVAEQHRETFAAMGQLFQNTNSMMQQIIQWQAQNHQQSMDRAKTDQQFALDRERQAQERERDRERQRAKESRQVAEQARENDRSHYRALAELHQNQSSLGGAKKLLNEFGLKPADLFSALKGGESEAGTGSAIISVLGDVAKSFAAASGEAAKAQAEAQTQQLALAAQLQQNGAMEAEPDGYIDADYDDEDDFIDEPAAVASPPPTSGSSPDVLAAFRESPSPEQISLPLAVQKKARVVARQLVQSLQSAPSSDWEDLIMQTVVSTPELREYVKAVSIRKALIEGGATNGLDDQVISIIDQSGLVPADIPRG